MKKLALISHSIFFLSVMLSNTVFATTASSTISDAQKGCQKSIGYFPTPAKLRCLLTALGVSETEIKAKALAIIFTVCQGHTSQPHPGYKVKKYSTLSACLSDPAGIEIINKELAGQGFSPIKVTNPAVLTSKEAQKP